MKKKLVDRLPKIKKKPSKSKLKKKAWDLCSEYIRRKYANLDGLCECVSCTAVLFWKGKGMQAGHFIQGRRNSILFEENGIHPQCYGCNIGRRGNVLPYLDFMLKKYGQAEVDRLRALEKKSVTYTEKDYEEIAENFRNKIRKLRPL